jgi:tetratricopeptide (TPR) repeat protein/cellulose biosynthesis protein BcsQ
MSGFPYIFTFFSFKGGVGRSMALINVAYQLSGFGRHVLIIDMDLEAPGISGFLDRHGELSERRPKDAIDLVLWARDRMLGNDDAHKALPELNDYAVPVKSEKVMHPQLGDPGRLDVIPVHEDRDFIGRLKDLGLSSLEPVNVKGIGEILHAYLKMQRVTAEPPEYFGLKEPHQVPYDYVLIDSRTGYADITGLCIGLLADRLVVLLGLNDQNIEGTRRFMDLVGITMSREELTEAWDEADAGPDEPGAPPRLGPKPTLIVASPVPVGEIGFKRARVDQIVKELKIRPLRLSYHPLLALQESLFVRDYRDEYLAYEYGQLALSIMATVKDHPAQLAEAVHNYWNIEKDGLSAIEHALKLAHCQPMTGISFLEQLGIFEPQSDAEFAASVLLLHALLRAAERPSARVRLGGLLSSWSEKTQDKSVSDARLAEAIRQCELVINSPKATIEEKAVAFYYRGYSHINQNKVDQAIIDFTTVIEMEEAPEAQVALALFRRGTILAELGDSERAIEDFNEIIKKENKELMAIVLVNRGNLLNKQGDSERAIEDYTAVIDMANVSSGMKAAALINRADILADSDSTERAIFDYQSATVMKDVLPEIQAEAFGKLGWLEYKLERHEDSIVSFSNALSLDQTNDRIRDNLALALASAGRLEEALSEYGKSRPSIDTEEELLNSAATDLRALIEREPDLQTLTKVLEMVDLRRRMILQEGGASE